MGLLSSVLAGPVKLVTWTAGQILEVAESQYYDEQAIFAALKELNEDYDHGRLDDESFAAAEDALMERLAVARDGLR